MAQARGRDAGVARWCVDVSRDDELPIRLLVLSSGSLDARRYLQYIAKGAYTA
jgi:hypothetical protein